MTGPIALHGGGEYVAGDEAAMDALLEAGIAAWRGSGPVRVVLVPTAVARHRPDLAAAHGARAFREAGVRAGIVTDIVVAPVLDRGSAADAAIAARFDDAHVIHLPGGDPDLIPAILRDSPAWAAMRRAHSAGACLAGASAGAMALAERLWTRDEPDGRLGRGTRCCRAPPLRSRAPRDVAGSRRPGATVDLARAGRADARHRATGWPVAGCRTRAGVRGGIGRRTAHGDGPPRRSRIVIG